MRRKSKKTASIYLKKQVFFSSVSDCTKRKEATPKKHIMLASLKKQEQNREVTQSRRR